jgi:hypothetical protein
MKNLSKIFGALLYLVIIINFAGIASAQNKVVVVPIGSEDYQDPTNGLRTLLFDADSIGGTAPSSPDGLSFSNTFNGSTCCAFLVIKRPSDWDGTSDITVELFTRGVTTGTDSFFVRPRDYDDGDTFSDTAGVQSDIRDFTSTLQFRQFTVSLQAASLPKDWWYLLVQRNTSGGTNTGDITLLSVAVSYTAIQ